MLAWNVGEPCSIPFSVTNVQCSTEQVTYGLVHKRPSSCLAPQKIHVRYLHSLNKYMRRVKCLRMGFTAARALDKELHKLGSKEH